MQYFFFFILLVVHVISHFCILHFCTLICFVYLYFCVFWVNKQEKVWYATLRNVLTGGGCDCDKAIYGKIMSDGITIIIKIIIIFIIPHICHIYHIWDMWRKNRHVENHNHHHTHLHCHNDSNHNLCNYSCNICCFQKIKI